MMDAAIRIAGAVRYKLEMIDRYAEVLQDQPLAHNGNRYYADLLQAEFGSFLIDDGLVFLLGVFLSFALGTLHGIHSVASRLLTDQFGQMVAIANVVAFLGAQQFGSIVQIGNAIIGE